MPPLRSPSGGPQETISDMWTDYLELLARDAAAVEYEAPVLAGRAEGASADVVEQLERGKVLALRVREKLVSQRRRERELTALYETADDLARLNDLDAVLEAIVHRARAVLRTDVTYLTLNDPERGDTYMRVTDGSISARFQGVRLAMGEGLGGRVAQNAKPYATSRYFDDERFDHTDDIDGAVAEEGLVAILGVPLQLGSHVIGVLYAANRSERPFSRSEVALLGSLAAHAAAAIDKARLLDETRVALAELRNVNMLLREHSLAVERAADAHDRMAQLVLRGGGVEDVALALIEVIGGSLEVVDEESRTLAKVGESPGPWSDAAAKAVLASQASGRATSCATDDTQWACALTAGPQHLGALLLTREEPLDDADQRILERAAVVTALLMLSLRSGVEAENRVRGDLLEDMLRNPDADPEGLLDRARHLGHDLTVPQTVLVVAFDGIDRQRAVAAVQALTARRGGLSGSFEGRLVVMVPGDEPGDCAHAVADELRHTLGRPVTVGGSGPVADVAGVPRAHREAARCVSALEALGRTGQGATFAELGFVGLVLGDEADVAGFVRATLGPVLEYDARRGTDLVGTLATYFDSGCNLSRTREALHVHVNTVAQRLERIGRLVGEDWHRPERQLELQVALRLHRLASDR
jgi:GAF domain-containing protein